MNSFWQFADIFSSAGVSYEGWPNSLGDHHFYGSPLAFDVNKDGLEELISVDDKGLIHIAEVTFLIR